MTRNSFVSTYVFWGAEIVKRCVWYCFSIFTFMFVAVNLECRVTIDLAPFADARDDMYLETPI